MVVRRRGRPEPVGAVAARAPGGITLTEILIAIMILGIGLVSLATLFPIGLLRLREAARWSRSATLLQTAASDAVSRGLFGSQSFLVADQYNYVFSSYGLTPWYYSAFKATDYNPLIIDSPYYGGDPYNQNGNPGATAGGGPGLPFAYDPLWRYQTMGPSGLAGYYLDPVNGSTFEARFGYGLPTIRPDPDGNGPPSAHGLPRLTNFNRPFVVNGGSTVPIMPAALNVPNIFVSQEDVVWQDATNNSNTYTIDGVSLKNGGTLVNGPSPIVPDLNVSGGSLTLEWRFTWMFTGQLTNAGNASSFDGNIVIFENRPFGIQTPATAPFTPQGAFASQNYQVDGETVVEAIFGFSTNVIGPGGQPGGPGYGAAADRTVLLRWPATMADPVVRPGDWIADVTYERQQNVVLNRFLNGFGFLNPPAGLPNFANNLEWDNVPAQRCYWYQVQKVGTPAPALGNMAFGTDPGPYRYMVVFVNQNLLSRTVLAAGGQPVFLNAALIAPNVVNVIPQTFFVR